MPWVYEDRQHSSWTSCQNVMSVSLWHWFQALFWAVHFDSLPQRRKASLAIVTLGALSSSDMRLGFAQGFVGFNVSGEI